MAAPDLGRLATFRRLNVALHVFGNSLIHNPGDRSALTLCDPNYLRMNRVRHAHANRGRNF